MHMLVHSPIMYDNNLFVDAKCRTETLCIFSFSYAHSSGQDLHIDFLRRGDLVDVAPLILKG